MAPQAPGAFDRRDDYPYVPVLNPDRYRNPVIHADYSERSSLRPCTANRNRPRPVQREIPSKFWAARVSTIPSPHRARGISDGRVASGLSIDPFAEAAARSTKRCCYGRPEDSAALCPTPSRHCGT